MKEGSAEQFPSARSTDSTDSNLESIDSTVSVSKEDISTWLRGAHDYTAFVKSLSSHKLSFVRQASAGSLGPLQAMFLSEKPAVFNDRVALGLSHELARTGFLEEGRYVYKTELVQAVVEDHRTDCSRWNANSTHDAIMVLNRTDSTELAVLRGLVLGIPLSSAIAFEKASRLAIHRVAEKLYHEVSPSDQKYMESKFFSHPRDTKDIRRFFEDQLSRRRSKLGLKEGDIPILLEQLGYLLGAKLVDVYGVRWIDYESNEDSRLKQRRLSLAFEYSGILTQIVST